MFVGTDRETDTRSYKDFITFNFQYHILNMNFELHFNTNNTITKVYQSGTHLAIYSLHLPLDLGVELVALGGVVGEGGVEPHREIPHHRLHVQLARALPLGPALLAGDVLNTRYMKQVFPS